MSITEKNAPNKCDSILSCSNSYETYMNYGLKVTRPNGLKSNLYNMMVKYIRLLELDTKSHQL